jgi:hypothetical protein
MNHEYPSPESWDAPRVPEQPPEPWHALRESWWRRLWGRLTARFRRAQSDENPMPEPSPAIQMPSLLDIHEPSDEFTIETPALGDAFNFLVQVRCSWCVQATAPEEEKEKKIAEVREFIQKSRAITRDRIEERVRPIARTFPPYRAAEAEKVLNEKLFDCLNDGDVQVTVRTWVDVSDPVREDLQKVWRHRLVVDADGDLKKAHIELLDELQEAWQKLLIVGLEGIGAVEEAKTGWLAPYALALAEDPKPAAGYLKDILEKRVDHAERLLADLGALAIDDRFEAIEFAFHSESALRALLTYLGVPVPTQDQAASGLRGGIDA